MAQTQLPTEVLARLELSRVFEVASYSTESDRYFGIVGIASDRPFLFMDVLLVRMTVSGPEVLFQMSDHAALSEFREARRASASSGVTVLDVNADAYPDLFVHVACECMDNGAEVLVDGKSRRAVVYVRGDVDEGGVYPRFFEPLPEDHDLAVHAAFLLGWLYDNPFEAEDCTFNEVVKDRDCAVDIAQPLIFAP